MSRAAPVGLLYYCLYVQLMCEEKEKKKKKKKNWLGLGMKKERLGLGVKETG